jgi:hypothetical protein
MFSTTNEYIPQKFTEESLRLSGDKSRSPRRRSPMSAARKKAENDIAKLCTKEGKSVDQVVTQVLKNSTADLSKYVRARGEKAQDDPVKLAVQAILLRMGEMATVAKALDTTDADALEMIESGEWDAHQTGNADAYNMLPPTVQGAINTAIEAVKAIRIDQGKNPGTQFIVSDIQKVTGASSNGYDIDTNCVLCVPGGQPIGSPSLGGSNLGNVSVPDYYKGSFNGFAEDDLDILAAQNTSTTGATGSGGFNWDSVIGSLGGIISSIGGLIDKGKGAVTDVINQGQNAATGIGGDILGSAMSKMLKDNLPIIIGGFLFILVIILIIVYAAKRK